MSKGCCHVVGYLLCFVVALLVFSLSAIIIDSSVQFSPVYVLGVVSICGENLFTPLESELS